MTARNAATGASRDVEVSAEPDTTVGSVLDALPLPAAGRLCYVGDDWLDPAATVGESPLVQGSIITIGAPGATPRSLPRGIVGALRVVDGRDAGLVAWLAPGRRFVGRSADADLVLHCEEASRQHAVLEIDVDGRALAGDAGSHNGTFLDGVQLTAPAEPAASAAPVEPVELSPGALLEVGSDRIEWVPLPAAPLVTRPGDDGRLDFDRAFDAPPAVSRGEVTLPMAHARPATSRAGVWLSALLPVVMGVVLALVLGRLLILLMCLLGPLTIVGSQTGERRARRAEHDQRERARAAALSEIARRLDAEERVRRRRAPDQLELTMAATGASRKVWPRTADSPDALVLRLGLTDAPPTLDLRGERWEGFPEPRLRSVPLTVDLRAAGVLGIAGPEEPSRALARFLLAQVGVLRGPDDLRLVLLTSSDDGDPYWATWLPHTWAGEANDIPCWVGNTATTRAERTRELRELIALRTAERRGHSQVRFAEDVVVLLDGALPLRELAGMRAVLRDGPEAGVYVIAVDRHDMAECRVQCVVDDKLMIRVTGRDGERVGRAEGLTTAEAEALARAVAPLRDRLTLGSVQASIPYPVRFLDLLGIGQPDARDVADLWSASPGPTTRVPLGADADGPVTVDLAAQGPHTMLGGATGAGKSILLQTLVTSLLLANSPDELNLVLVDFKGGSAFLPFEHCPHVVALIRSTGQTAADVFDEAAARRVLASVRAEVSRRERLLAHYGGEIDEYWRELRAHGGTGTGGTAGTGTGAGGAGGRGDGAAPAPALPRLVMIFDEFARVLETSPDFLKELVNVAAKGRSLGMHLVLATQSLQGKLSAELKNNIDLRITLRQNEPADSVEVLGVPDAAAIPGRLRGRGMILRTKDETRTPRLFQSGYLGDPPPMGGARPARVRTVGWVTLGTPRPEEKVDHGGAATDQTLTIRAIEQAAALVSGPAPFRPFRPLRPPLPAELTAGDLAAMATTTPTSGEIPFGLLDEPAAQAQPPAVLDLDGTDRLLVAGGPQTGRTTLARTLIAGLALRFRPDSAQFYVIEHQPAGLADYAELPHCGAVISAREPDRIRRLLTWLADEVTTRQTARLGAGGSGRHGGPRILLIVDGWDYFENRSDPTFVETSMLTLLRDVIATGPPVGVHVVAIGGQDLAASRTANLFTRRVLLPFGKEELRRMHYPSGVASPPELPGRAVEASSGTHLQVARHHLTAIELARLVASRPGAAVTSVDVDVDAGTDAAVTNAAVGADRLPRPFPSLPTAVTVDELAPPDPRPSATWLPLGVGGRDATAIGLDLFGAGPQGLIVSGPAGSGRTTAAATIARGLRHAGVGVLLVVPPRSELPRLLGLGLRAGAGVGDAAGAGDAAVAGDAAGDGDGAGDGDEGVRVVTGSTLKDADLREAAEAFGDGRFAVIVDDCDQIAVSASVVNFAEAPTLLEEAASPAARGRLALVLCGDATPVFNGQRRSLLKVANEIKTSGGILLLTPTSPHTARDHGLRLEPDQFFPAPAGRGYLITQGAATLLQLAG
ncbi:FtsK/SpoIIIE domain-containing protein [Pseudofrankia saprophytica]|uniref:FtsK/SpoIIIE domain-containing protein n=1 Tax=Pseudofrankia saprophytica TaxID=298655 RepID=UPI001E384B4A|nr:FtsK/SpoIIIE domain-containing protein [Pseudofrankia saprophytica]